MGFRIAAGTMALLFFVSAIVQWNDPDPLAWIGLYGLAGVLAGAAALGHLWLWPNALGLALFGLLLALWAPSLGDARSEAFTSFQMVDTRDEEPRETAGLAVCALWTGVQCAVAWRRRDG